MSPRHAAILLLLAGALGGCGSVPTGSGFRTASATDERECLARAMYFESNRSSPDGQLAVGTVVMNRLGNPAYPKTICGVVGQRNQFAPGAMTEPMTSRATPKVFRVADAVLAGARHPSVGKAMFFHTAGYRFPYKNMHYVTLAGGNIFYDKRRNPTGTQTMVASLEKAQRRIALASLETPIPDRAGNLFDFSSYTPPEAERVADAEAETPKPVRARTVTPREPAPARLAPVVLAEVPKPAAKPAPIRVAAAVAPRPAPLAFKTAEGKPADNRSAASRMVASRPVAQPATKVAVIATPPVRPGKATASFSLSSISVLLAKYDGKKDGKPTRVSALRRTISEE